MPAEKLVYTNIIQKFIGPSNYWRDPFRIEQYTKKATSLPLLDNTRTHANAILFRDNFAALEQLVILGSTEDGVLRPPETAWFGVWEALRIQPFDCEYEEFKNSQIEEEI